MQIWGHLTLWEVLEKEQSLKKVPVTAPKGEMIYDDTRSGNDMLSCEKQTLKRLEFQVTDELGNIMDLQGHDISWSLIFSIMP